MICLFRGPSATASEDVPANGRIEFLSVARAARRRIEPITSHHAEVLLRTAGYLADEVAGADLPTALRGQMIVKIGELIATAWAHRPPARDAEPNAAVRRIALEARSNDAYARAAAEAALRAVVEVLGGHARTPPHALEAGPEYGARAIETLVRIDHAMGVLELLGISRDAPEAAARRLATTKLGELAARKYGAAFAETCARLLLE